MMKLTQLSVFLENRPGHLSNVCGALSAAHLNIAALTMADTREFGILRLILREWKQAREALEAAGFVVNTTDVVALEVPDRPGGLESILKQADAVGLSVEYMYAFAIKQGENARIVIRFDDMQRAVEVLESTGITFLRAADFYKQ